MGSNQTYKLLHSKGNHTKKKKKKRKERKKASKKASKQAMKWEKIVANNATDKGFISKIHKQLI